MDNLSEDYLNSKINALFKDIDRIRQIINHVRIFSRDQDSEMLETVDLNEVIYDALSMVSKQYNNHNIKIKLKLSDNKCFTIGNKYRIEQVILNLLSNAKYAVEERQKLSKSDLYTKIITIRSFEENGHVVFEIEDNGTGIPKKSIDNIFDPFFTTKDVESGTGLGLSITYGIIKEMKGDISVESKSNEFTRMKVALPKN